MIKYLTKLNINININMNIESPIKIDTNVNVSIDVAEIIKQRSINYGYDKFFYIGDKSIRLYSIDKHGNKILNDEVEDCKCNKCPYAKKSRANLIFKKKRDFKLCNCQNELKSIYQYFTRSEMWSGYIILQLECKICRKQFINPNHEDIVIPDNIAKIIKGSKP
jgi:hypothetical protein